MFTYITDYKPYSLLNCSGCGFIFCVFFSCFLIFHKIWSIHMYSVVFKEFNLYNFQYHRYFTYVKNITNSETYRYLTK